MEQHDYTGDPKHCHGCAVRAFVLAELRTRSVEVERDRMKYERDRNQNAYEGSEAWARLELTRYRTALQDLVTHARPAFAGTPFRKAIDQAKKLLGAK